ncbi:Uncharacterised protein [Mycobacteroides abscessus subsp. abscessus]|uniref:hypothetical protein n=1 Tax=Mycobacteroides abscessus TaxID=36809 RepID=UPI00092B4A77|nr:hypothetical protein [Mycobacteroides abscessus]SIE35449.1 Uncharacterised protein [Mycobacteroides abscessus subsp. abscessus]SKV16555.1 Uncharacterised protein [Mycobacteroides abscessus subsp. abscessus]
MGWNRTPIRDAQWRVPLHPKKQTQALEQDRAAGGRAQRIMPDCGALGRIVLRRQYNRIYAELRWQVDKKQCSEYLGGVCAETRAANLALAWQEARRRRLDG